MIKDVKHDLLYGLELAGYKNGFRFQSELIGNNTKVKNTNAEYAGTHHFGGWYVMAGTSCLVDNNVSIMPKENSHNPAEERNGEILKF